MFIFAVALEDHAVHRVLEDRVLEVREHFLSLDPLLRVESLFNRLVQGAVPKIIISSCLDLRDHAMNLGRLIHEEVVEVLAPYIGRLRRKEELLALTHDWTLV